MEHQVFKPTFPLLYFLHSLKLFATFLFINLFVLFFILGLTTTLINVWTLLLLLADGFVIFLASISSPSVEINSSKLLYKTQTKKILVDLNEVSAIQISKDLKDLPTGGTFGYRGRSGYWGPVWFQIVFYKEKDVIILPMAYWTKDNLNALTDFIFEKYTKIENRNDLSHLNAITPNP